MTLMSPKVTRITLVTKSLVFMRFSSISINLLEFFRIMSFVFDLKYLSQNSINFNMLGVFWNPQDEQFPKLSLDLNLEQHLKEILRVLHWCRCWLPPLYLAEGVTDIHHLYQWWRTPETDLPLIYTTCTNSGVHQNIKNTYKIREKFCIQLYAGFLLSYQI